MWLLWVCYVALCWSDSTEKAYLYAAFQKTHHSFLSCTKLLLVVFFFNFRLSIFILQPRLRQPFLTISNSVYHWSFLSYFKLFPLVHFSRSSLDSILMSFPGISSWFLPSFVLCNPSSPPPSLTLVYPPDPPFSRLPLTFVWEWGFTQLTKGEAMTSQQAWYTSICSSLKIPTTGHTQSVCSCTQHLFPPPHSTEMAQLLLN